MPGASSVNLNRLAAFAAVVESGSFTAAAEKLGLTKAMVSQHVSRLEKELGIGLLNRTTRKVTATETGPAFYADCAQVLQEVEAAIARVGGGSDVPSGTLRLTTPEDYGSAVVVPALAGYMHRFPAVKVEFVATDQVVDLVAGRFDLAIRTGWLRESSLRATRLGAFVWSACWRAGRCRRAACTRCIRMHATPRQKCAPLWTFCAPISSSRLDEIKRADVVETRGEGRGTREKHENLVLRKMDALLCRRAVRGGIPVHLRRTRTHRCIAHGGVRLYGAVPDSARVALVRAG